MGKALDILIKKVREDIETRRAALTGGQCATFEQYKELTGIIRGLILAEQHIFDLARTMEDSDD